MGWVLLSNVSFHPPSFCFFHTFSPSRMKFMATTNMNKGNGGGDEINGLGWILQSSSFSKFSLALHRRLATLPSQRHSLPPAKLTHPLAISSLGFSQISILVEKFSLAFF
ncbi:hypothetical protein MRB53_010352 [Persea americana]|uniref:Uncharacterized protein n=1 Tax=Persea americana TaxID=3435 RepID=A0ACC2LRT4_PERAE|nr:hypothetical protein MRB53_010352 [Persea americana]